VEHLNTSVQFIVNGNAGQMANGESRGKLKSLTEAAYPSAAIVFTDAGMDGSIGTEGCQTRRHHDCRGVAVMERSML